MSVKRDYNTKTEDNMELEPLGGLEPKSPDKENLKSNGAQFGKFAHTQKSVSFRIPIIKRWTDFERISMINNE